MQIAARQREEARGRADVFVQRVALFIGAALEELEASFPYIKGKQVIATDEEGDPLYEDVGPTPRFLTLSRRYLHDLSAQSDKQKH